MSPRDMSGSVTQLQSTRVYADVCGLSYCHQKPSRCQWSELLPEMMLISRGHADIRDQTDQVAWAATLGHDDSGPTLLLRAMSEPMVLLKPGAVLMSEAMQVSLVWAAT